MHFWTLNSPLQLALTALLLALVLLVVRRFAAGPVPVALRAGIAAMVLGPAALGWLPLSTDALEFMVYHALGLVFLVVALTPTASRERSSDARASAF